jgi:beta-galactosidase
MIALSNVIAYNYRTDYFDEWHSEYPDQVFLASETRPYATTLPEDFNEVDFSNNSWFDLGEHVAGQFIWAGIDYLGESMGWPDRGFKHGILKTNGFRKPLSYFLSSIYNENPMVKLHVIDTLMADSMNNINNWQMKWAGPPLVDHWTFKNDYLPLQIVVFTNCKSVELILNDRIIDTLYKSDFPDGVIRKNVHYEKGTLVAKATHFDRFGGKTFCFDTLQTAGKPYAIVMDPDKFALIADGTDMLHITTKIVDSIGILNPHSRHTVHYELKGPGRLMVIDNGDLSDLIPYGSLSKGVRNGAHLVIIRSGVEPGDLIIKASAKGLNPAQINIPLEK